MKNFLDEDFLLSSDIAKQLYHNHAEQMPIVDYHCHINPKEIAEDIRFDDISQVWLGGDHYKWRLMRTNGIDESLITGNASGKEKFMAFAKTLQIAIGNPIYHWSHLELKRYFGYNGVLTEETAEEVWDLCNAKLQEKDMSARGIIKASNVKVICTTDDPIDDLHWHKLLKDDTSFETDVYPAFRPDRAMNLEKPDYIAYINKLSECSNQEIHTFKDLITALDSRIAYFDSCGCRISDHGLEYVMYTPATDAEIETIFTKRLHNESLTMDELLMFKTAFMIQVGRLYHKYNWVMQLHYGTKRDNNTRIFNAIGADTGFDCIHKHTPTDTLANYLNALCITDELPKTLIKTLVTDVVLEPVEVSVEISGIGGSFDETQSGDYYRKGTDDEGNEIFIFYTNNEYEFAAAGFEFTITDKNGNVLEESEIASGSGNKLTINSKSGAFYFTNGINKDDEGNLIVYSGYVVPFVQQFTLDANLSNYKDNKTKNSNFLNPSAAIYTIGRYNATDVAEENDPNGVNANIYNNVLSYKNNGFHFGLSIKTLGGNDIEYIPYGDYITYKFYRLHTDGTINYEDEIRDTEMGIYDPKTDSWSFTAAPGTYGVVISIADSYLAPKQNPEKVEDKLFPPIELFCFYF